MLPAALAALVLCGCSGGGGSGEDGGEGRRSPSASGGTGSSAPSDPGAGGASAAPLDPARVQGAWWTWAASSPSGRNPVEDRTGAFCAAGQQPEGLWFLAGTFGGEAVRRCTVPAGRTLVAPLVNQVGDSEAACARFLSGATGRMTVDGAARPVLRWRGVLIRASGVARNPVTREGGAFGGYGCGLWASAPPLSPGTHRVAIRGANETLRVSVDYVLTVPGA